MSQEKEIEKHKIATYHVCYDREDIKYYDKEIDKVLVNPWYKYCDSYPYQNTGTQELEWSCVDTGCVFHKDPVIMDEEFNEQIGKKYFINY